MKVAILGGGVIGGGWAARFLLNGHDVAVFDPAGDAAGRVDAVLANARRALPGLYDGAMPREGRLTMAATLGEAVRAADWVQECVPERLALKHRVLGELADTLSGSGSLSPSAVVASSTSGFTPSALQEGAGRLRSQVLVAHPFQPVYLLPLVELVASAATDPAITERARAVLTGLGMAPLTVRGEIDAHIADRLLEAVWREALWLVHDGIATTAEIDEAIRLGFGLRWAQMGLFETYRIAGGDAGMRHFLAQFGPALDWPWSRLTDTPPFTSELVETIAGQSDAQSAGNTIRQLEHRRDDALVAFLRALSAQNHAAGCWIRAHDRAYAQPPACSPEAAPMRTVARQLPAIWGDDGGRVPPMRLAELFDQASAVVARALVPRAPDAAGLRAVESHVREDAAVTAGAKVSVLSQVVAVGEGGLHLLHRLLDLSGVSAACCEHVLRPVAPGSGELREMSPGLAAAATALAQAHIALERPETLRLSL